MRYADRRRGGRRSSFVATALEYQRGLATPTLALANAARETLCMGDVMDHMMILQREVLHGKRGQDKEVRQLDDDVDVLYTINKLYLAQI